MGKFLLFLILAAVVWGLLKSRLRVGSRVESQPAPDQKMVACAHCGMYLPEDEAVGDASGRYCSSAHQAAGTRKGS